LRARILAAIPASWRARAAVAPAVLLVLVALWETVAARRDATAVPDDAAWSHAAAVVRAAHEPGDLIVFAPSWVDPVGRLHLGDLIPVEMAARMDAARYGRIWELSIRGADAPEVAGLRPVLDQDVDGVRVRRFERAPAIVLSDVFSAQPGVIAEVGFEPHRCIELVPSPGHPAKLTIPMTLGTKLVGGAGLADVFTRRDIRAPGTLAVEIAGKEVARVQPGVDDGWVRFEAPTAPGAAEVTFIASADAPQRLICFAAEARQ
jgi:hypothetical protein